MLIEAAEIKQCLASKGVEEATLIINTVKHNPKTIAQAGSAAKAVENVANGKFAKGVQAGTKTGRIPNAANKVGKDFEEFLVKELKGEGSFKIKSARGTREFDGAVGNVWYEAKSGQYWDMLQSNKKEFDKFKTDMGKGFHIARDNGAIYKLHSNSPIPQPIKDWLTEKNIPFTEWL